MNNLDITNQSKSNEAEQHTRRQNFLNRMEQKLEQKQTLLYTD